MDLSVIFKISDFESPAQNSCILNKIMFLSTRLKTLKSLKLWSLTFKNNVPVLKSTYVNVLNEFYMIILSI